MKLKHIMSFTVLLGLAPLAATAQNSPNDAIMAALAENGYEIISTNKTWLGRIRIVAEKDGARREIVFIPGTGEVLRDFAMFLPTDSSDDSDNNSIAAAGKPATTAVRAGNAAAVGVTEVLTPAQTDSMLGSELIISDPITDVLDTAPN